MKSFVLILFLLVTTLAHAKVDCVLELDPIGALKAQLPTAAVIRPFFEFEKTNEYETPKQSKVEIHKVEVAEYVWVDNPEIQEILDQVHAMGGQVRHLQKMTIDKKTNQPIKFEREPAYFWVNLSENLSSSFVPIIATDLTRDYALSSLAHEFDHFKKWKAKYDELAATGMKHKAICRMLDKLMATPQWRRESEKSATDVEVDYEKRFAGHIYMRTGGFIKPTDPSNILFINRMSYPDFEAVRVEIIKKRPNFVTAYADMLELVKFAAANRVHDKTLRYLIAEPSGIERLDTPLKLKRFQRLLMKACDELRLERCIEAKAFDTEK